MLGPYHMLQKIQTQYLQLQSPDGELRILHNPRTCPWLGRFWAMGEPNSILYIIIVRLQCYNVTVHQVPTISQSSNISLSELWLWQYVRAYKQQSNWNKPVQGLSYVIHQTYAAIANAHPWFQLPAKSDDEGVAEILRAYDRRGITNRSLISRMLAAEHNITMRLVPIIESQF